MGQTPEIRIRKQYKKLRRSYWTYEYGIGAMWLTLARQWKRPVQEIKRICQPHKYNEKG